MKNGKLDRRQFVNRKKETIQTVLLFFLFTLIVSCDNDDSQKQIQPIGTPLIVITDLPVELNSTSLSPLATEIRHMRPTVVRTKQPPTAMLTTPTPDSSTLITTIPALITLPGAIYRISVSSTGMESNDSSEGVSITANGEKFAFVSFASNLIEGDVDNDCVSISGNSISCVDVFVKEFNTDKVTRVSVSNSGLSGNGHSGIIREWGSHTSISSDGRYVVFHSDADNFVADVASRSSYLYDMELNQIKLIGSNNDSLETTIPFYSINPVISANGRYVVFQSNNPYLVDDDTNGVDDVFFYDTQTGQTELVSIGVDGNLGDRASGAGYPATVSDDGRFVAFALEASNLILDDNNNLLDVFLRDRVLQETIRVSTNNVDKDLGESNGMSTNPVLSANGQLIVFQSSANNLTQGDINDFVDVFLYDLSTKYIEPITVNGNGDSVAPDISSNGQRLIFSSDADNLVSLDTNGVTDVFIYDINTERTIRVSVNAEGEEGNHISYFPAISDDGSVITFVSLASNLVPNDLNERWDIFVREIKLFAPQ